MAEKNEDLKTSKLLNLLVENEMMSRVYINVILIIEFIQSTVGQN